jgi:hypothetical protein
VGAGVHQQEKDVEWPPPLAENNLWAATQAAPKAYSSRVALVEWASRLEEPMNTIRWRQHVVTIFSATVFVLLIGVIEGLGACGGSVGSGPGSACSGTPCVASDACTGATCSGHGTCVLTNGNATCQCETNYHTSGLSCVQDNCTPTVHASSTCDAGSVYWFDSCGTRQELKQSCANGCANGACTSLVNPCAGATCSGFGTCVVTGGSAACQCNGGYHPSGLSCVLDGVGAAACSPALARAGEYFGFAEQFNRYYTDCAWQPASTVYVSPNGTGDGSSRASPAGVTTALAAVVPGRMVVFTAGTYSGCFELDSDHGGTYDEPIVLVGDRKADGSPDVTINCCSSGRQTCINLESADYVAVDGFEVVGGYYGVRSVGAGYPADQHQKGVTVLNTVGHDQFRDPFFTGESDWFVIQSCTGHDPGTGDGHGIYLSNGSDWNIARWNETYNTRSSDFQINADPLSTCSDDGVPFDDPECDAVAGSSTTGGRGASDFMLVEGNFFHHSQAQGPNFTSVRNSVVRNNIFALPAQHGASFWQQTDNPRLGASNNLFAHNLVIVQANNRQALGVIVNSTGNQIKNNVFVAVSISGTTISANDSGQLLSTDATTVAANTFEHNAWISGFFGSEDSAPAYTPNATELRRTDFDAAWFAALPTTVGRDPAAFIPTASAPWLNQGNLLPEVPTDRVGTTRTAPVDLGPYEQ